MSHVVVLDLQHGRGDTDSEDGSQHGGGRGKGGGTTISAEAERRMREVGKTTETGPDSCVRGSGALWMVAQWTTVLSVWVGVPDEP